MLASFSIILIIESNLFLISRFSNICCFSTIEELKCEAILSAILDGSLSSKKGNKYIKRSGFCLETQFFPNSPNTQNFPSTVLEPGNKFSSMTTFKFSLLKN